MVAANWMDLLVLGAWDGRCADPSVITTLTARLGTLIPRIPGAGTMEGQIVTIWSLFITNRFQTFSQDFLDVDRFKMI